MKKILTILGAFLVSFSFLGNAQVTVQKLRLENLINPIGVDAQLPRFSWQIVSPKRNVSQSAYEIWVAESPEMLKSGKNLVWKSGKVASDKSVHVPYAGSTLQSGKKYYWQVKVWDNAGKASAWSSNAYWHMGMLDKSLWKAKWIKQGFQEDTIMRPSPLFRKQFQAQKKVVSATAYITALGLYEAQINGKRVGDAYFTPGWTAYKKRLQYQVYDVTSLLLPGANAIGVMLGNGWYRGIIGYENNINVYGKEIALLFQLDVRYSDGTSELIVSDDSWKSSTGAIQYAEIYNGETLDSRKDKKGWAMPGYDDSKWSGVKLSNYSNDILIATCNEPVRKKETFQPVKFITTPKGEKVIDFG